MNEQGRRVLVTGAGSGIGDAVARRLAKAGYRVVGTVRDRTRAERLTGETAGTDAPVRYLPLELGSEDQVSALAARLEHEGGIDVLVHNAGFGVFGSVEEIDAASTARQFQVHVFGPLALTRALLPGLRARRGRIVWVGSLAGRMALPFQGHYSATKAAIASLSDALRMELAPHGVQVTCVEPSDFATGFTDARCQPVSGQSVYSEASARCLAEAEKQERGAPRPEWVAKVVQSVIEQANPPARRPVGTNARLTCLLHRLMPARLAERLIRAHYRV